ncbi:hypothetical protein CsSME_00048382 [Camellia sinensis var. sinensis]
MKSIFAYLAVNCISLSSKEKLYILHGFLEPVMSEFHFMLLLGNKVKMDPRESSIFFVHDDGQVVNRISEHIIEELQFDETPESMSRGIIGLCSDNSIFQVSVNDEGRNMWKVFLDLKEYAARDQVYLAEAVFSAKDFLRAASFYAKIYYILSFEEMTLKFISVNEQNYYVMRTTYKYKLDRLIWNKTLHIHLFGNGLKFATRK